MKLSLQSNELGKWCADSLLMNMMVLILFPDGIYFALELVYGCHPVLCFILFFFFLCHNSQVQDLLRGIYGSEIKTEGSHWVSQGWLSSTTPSFTSVSAVDHMQCWIFFRPAYCKKNHDACLLSYISIQIPKKYFKENLY